MQIRRDNLICHFSIMEEARRRITAWCPGEFLNLSSLGLENIPDLPANLKRLDCAENQLTSLEGLPAGLEMLNCAENQLTSLEGLPEGLKRLYCAENLLTSLEGLPAGLENLVCDENLLPLSLEWQLYAIQRRLALIHSNPDQDPLV